MDIQDNIKPSERDFDPSICILHIGTNDLLLEDTPEAISKRIIAAAKSLEKEYNKVPNLKHCSACA